MSPNPSDENIVPTVTDLSYINIIKSPISIPNSSYTSNILDILFAKIISFIKSFFHVFFQRKFIVHRLMGLLYLIEYALSFYLYFKNYNSFKSSILIWSLPLTGLIQSIIAMYTFTFLSRTKVDGGYFSDRGTLSYPFIVENSYFALILLFQWLYYSNQFYSFFDSSIIIDNIFVFLPYILRQLWPKTHFRDSLYNSDKTRTKENKKFFFIVTHITKLFYLWAKHYIGFFLNYIRFLNRTNDEEIYHIYLLLLFSAFATTISMFLHTLKFKGYMGPKLSFMIYITVIILCRINISMTDISLSTLPNELLYHILNYLDARFIILKLRRVSKQFYNITDKYVRYMLDVNSMSPSNLKIISRIIPAENITSLKFHDRESQRSQIELFFSIFNIDQFVRLQSITLGKFFYSKDYQHLDKLPVTNIISLHINSGARYDTQALPFISKVLTQSTLSQVDLIKSDYTIKRISWPKSNSIQHLTIQSCSFCEYNLILQCLPFLQTMVMAEFRLDQSAASIQYRQLISLTIEQFRTPFWLHEKQWIITCDYFLKENLVNFYTTPKCTMNFEEKVQSIRTWQVPSTVLRFHSIIDLLLIANDGTELQTSTKLNLNDANIQVHDTKYLADALQKNT
ncbi:hypothetical protein I4U23_022037, partial [Adineta vaga]